MTCLQRFPGKREEKKGGKKGKGRKEKEGGGGEGAIVESVNFIRDGRRREKRRRKRKKGRDSRGKREGSLMLAQFPRR